MSSSRSHSLALLFASAVLMNTQVHAAGVAEDSVPSTDLPQATDLPAETPAAASAPSTNVTVNLINRLVQKGVLSQAEASEMIQQAEADAATAKAETAALPPEPSPEEETRVTYIPEVVRNQMRDQIQQELMARAREEKWNEDDEPDWTSKFRPFGDIRVRSENVFFADGNRVDGSFPDFNKINTGSPFDESGSQFAPQRNVDQDRYRPRFRARLGTEILLGEGFNAGIRVATGDSNSPTSPNQTLGGSGGNFSKYALWLDRAFLSFEAGPGYGEELTFLAGRFDNPFFASEVMWDDDLGFDGLAVRGKVRVNDCLSTFFTAGYFPVYNTDFSFATNQPEKFDSTDKWLSGAQIGVEWKIQKDLTAKAAVAYYGFDNIEGKLSSPFIPLSASDAGDTDTTRPSFAQSGNTYIRLRNIDNSTSTNDFGNQNQYQYYGLASDFREIAITGRLDYDRFDPIRLSLMGEVIKNVAFDVDPATALNNFGDDDSYEGGDTAWYLAFIIGNPALEKFGDWQASIGYRYVESDAVVDGFTDSDFGGGGTNVQGFTLGGNMALTKSVRWGARWMSSDEVAGPQLSSDTLQIDLNAKF
jgi:hypothetical protein